MRRQFVVQYVGFSRQPEVSFQYFVSCQTVGVEPRSSRPLPLTRFGPQSAEVVPSTLHCCPHAVASLGCRRFAVNQPSGERTIICHGTADSFCHGAELHRRRRLPPPSELLPVSFSAGRQSGGAGRRRARGAATRRADAPGTTAGTDRGDPPQHCNQPTDRPTDRPLTRGTTKQRRVWCFGPSRTRRPFDQRPDVGASSLTAPSLPAIRCCLPTRLFASLLLIRNRPS